MSRNNINSVLIVGPNYPRRCGIVTYLSNGFDVRKKYKK